MGKRGPQPKPNETKRIAANPGDKPLPEKDISFTQGLIIPPDHLDDLAVKEWSRLCGELERNGLLTVADVAAFSIYCQNYSRWVKAEKAISEISKRDIVFNGVLLKGSTGNLVVNPLIRVATTAMQDMLKAAAHFGMTPAARSSVKLDDQGDENPFEKISTGNSRQ